MSLVISPHAAGRALVVQVTGAGEATEFLCADGAGQLTAERLAARRIRAWAAAQVA